MRAAWGKRRWEAHWHTCVLDGAFGVVVLPKGHRDLPHLLQGRRAMDQQTLSRKRAMQSLHIGILVGPLWWADVGLDPDTQQEAKQS